MLRIAIWAAWLLVLMRASSKSIEYLLASFKVSVRD